jgi:type II secretory pathway pseudopilin PulG
MNRRQTGASLMEVMIAMSISLVVTASMIALMANSLRTTARIIQMTKLSDDMRVALQMMSRDVRRSSYNANSMYCYANTDCADDGIVTAAGDITLVDLDADAVADCFTFLMDRDYDGDSTEDNAGGFRRVTDGDGIGSIEMWTGDSAPDCTDAPGAAGWVQITDPENMNISVFSVDDNLSYTQNILDDGVTTVSMKIRKVRMTMEGRLVLDNTIMRQMEDIIAVRNDLLL